MKKTRKIIGALVTGTMLLQGVSLPQALADNAITPVNLDFEDGTVGGLTLGEHAGSVEVSNAEENGNKFARVTISGDYANSADPVVMPDIYISPDYAIAPGSKTKISMKMRTNNIAAFERSLVFNYTDKTYQEMGNNTIWGMSRSQWNANRGCNIMGLTMFDQWKNGSITSYPGSNFYMNNPAADNWYKVDMTLYSNTDGKIVKYDVTWTDEENNTVLWALSNRSLQGERANIPLYNLETINTLGLNLRVVPATVSGVILDIDDLKVYNPDAVNTKVSLVSEGERESASDIQVQFSTKPDSLESMLGNVVIKKGAELISSTATYDNENSRIIITPDETLVPGRYTVTLPESMTVLGYALDEYEFTFIVTEQKAGTKEKYDFEDGKIPSNWKLNTTAGTADISVQTEENGNKYARVSMVGDWREENDFGKRPNLSVSLTNGSGYALTDKRWTDISMKVRFSDLTNTCFSMLVNQNANTKNEIENSRKLWGFTKDTNWTKKYDRLNIFNRLDADKTILYASTSLGKGPIAENKWYNVNVRLYNSDSECGNIWMYITDDDGNVIWNPGRQNIANDPVAKISRLNVIDTLNFDFTDFAKEITADTPITFDIDNLTVKEFGERATASLKNDIIEQGENVVIALSSALDFTNGYEDIKVLNENGTEISANASYNAGTKEITINFAEELVSGGYSIVFGDKMTAEGSVFAKTQYGFTVMTDNESLKYDFESGTTEGWKLGEANGTPILGTITEDGNTYLRMTVPKGTVYENNSQVSGYTSTQPDMFVRTGYRMLPNSSVEVSSKFRINVGENAIKDLRARMMINSEYNDLYSFGGNIYQIWGYNLSERDLRVMPYQEKTATCWWMPDKKQARGESLADGSIMEDNVWYTVKTIFNTDAEGKPQTASYYLYNADGMLEASLINKTVDNWSLRENDKILDIGFSFSGLLRSDDTISSLFNDITFDVDDICIRNVANSVEITDENGNAVTEIVKGHNYKVKYNYTNTGVKAAKPMYAIALYEKDGDSLNLVSVKAVKSLMNIAQGAEWSGISEEYVTADGTNVTAKAFLWENGCIPVCAADEI